MSKHTVTYPIYYSRSELQMLGQVGIDEFMFNAAAAIESVLPVQVTSFLQGLTAGNIRQFAFDLDVLDWAEFNTKSILTAPNDIQKITRATNVIISTIDPSRITLNYCTSPEPLADEYVIEGTGIRLERWNYGKN